MMSAMKNLSMLLITSPLLLAGCVSKPIDDLYDAEDHAWLKHVVVADSRGKFDYHLLPPGYPCLEAEGRKAGRSEVEACHLGRGVRRSRGLHHQDVGAAAPDFHPWRV